MQKLFWTWIMVLFALQGQAQFSQAARDSIRKHTRLDYDQMLSQLSIQPEDLRPGPSGNPNDPNAANSDEAKIQPYELPDPLVLNSGHQVSSVQEWLRVGKPEIIEHFENEMYGRLPDHIPAVEWQIVSVTDTMVGNYPIKEKLLRGVVDHSTYPSISVEIDLLVTTPQNARGPVPVIVHFGFIGPNPWNPGPIQPIGLGSAHEPTWKEQIISRGWGYATIVPSSIQADNGAGLTSGIIGLVNKGQHRKPDDWGSLRAWAWGVSKAIDFFESDGDIDASRIAIEGLSRYGKAAIVTMAFEPRISLGFIGSSGAGGAKILRRNFGEQVENLASSYGYHWFCGNFIQYAGPKTIHDLPVDAHSLVALCAPRPVFISSGSPQVEGNWIDAKGMFEAGMHAEKVYELFGKKGLGMINFPFLGIALTDGDIAYRQHAGGHSTGPNWSTWLAWASRYWVR